MEKYREYIFAFLKEIQDTLGVVHKDKCLYFRENEKNNELSILMHYPGSVKESFVIMRVKNDNILDYKSLWNRLVIFSIFGEDKILCDSDGEIQIKTFKTLYK